MTNLLYGNYKAEHLLKKEKVSNVCNTNQSLSDPTRQATERCQLLFPIFLIKFEGKTVVCVLYDIKERGTQKEKELMAIIAMIAMRGFFVG